jgi:hypothetical protein
MLVRVRIRLRILPFTSVTFKMATKKCCFLSCFAYYGTFGSYIYNIFQRKKVIKKSQNSRNQGYYFCLMDGSGFGPGTNRSRSESGRPKSMRILWFQIRVRNTAYSAALQREHIIFKTFNKIKAPKKRPPCLRIPNRTRNNAYRYR